MEASHADKFLSPSAGPTMHSIPIFFLSALLLMLAATVQPAPTSKGPHEEIHHLVSQYITIDSSCDENHAKVEKTMSDVYYISERAQAMQWRDAAFYHYYFTPAEAASKSISQDVLSLQVNGKLKTYELPQRDHSKVVPNMYKSILLNGGTKTKITVKCRGEELDKRECKDAYAAVVPEDPIINLCHQFFVVLNSQNPTFSTLDSKPFDSSGWCKAPYRLPLLSTGAEHVLHEMTHLSLIARHALEASVAPKVLKTPLWFTTDLYDFPDESDSAGKNFDTYDCYPAKAARTLKQRWLAYNAQEAALKHSRPKGLLNRMVLKAQTIKDLLIHLSSKSGGGNSQVKGEDDRKLKQPPIDPIDVAQGFQSAATEFYFWKMCKGFNPVLVQPD